MLLRSSKIEAPSDTTLSRGDRHSDQLSSTALQMTMSTSLVSIEPQLLTADDCLLRGGLSNSDRGASQLPADLGA